MATVDFESLTKPVSEEAPCGDDLDLAGDMEYMNFVAGAEGLLPKSYFIKDQSGNEGRPFDRTTINFEAQFEAAKPFLEQTRDLRLIGILAKLCILNRDFLGFVACVRAIGALLADRWDDVHPRPENGDLSLRMVAIESIESMPTIVMPLQFFPFIQHRSGNVSYRAVLIGKGEVKRTEGEPAVDNAAIERTLQDVELPLLIERRQQLLELDAALKQIQSVWLDRSPDGAPVSLDRLVGVASGMLTTVNDAVVARDPSAAISVAPVEGADQPGEQAAPVAADAVNSTATAASALAAVAAYFDRNEPSNPALLLVRQAQTLVGKSFLEVIQLLVPDLVPKAAVNIGNQQYFQLPVQKMPAASVGGDGQSAAAGNGAAEVHFEAKTRGQALALLEQVGRYFGTAEPSSPIPFFLERARDLATRDFLSVLKNLLPGDALKTMK